MTQSVWVFDDSKIPDWGTLYRRVPRENPDFLTRDLETNQVVVHPAAFRYVKDGMSVARHELLEAAGQTVADLPWPAERFVIASFLVSTVRSGGGGVVDAPDPADALTGHAHALVRTSEPPPDKGQWSDVRNAILQEHDLVDLLPEGEDD